MICTRCLLRQAHKATFSLPIRPSRSSKPHSITTQRRTATTTASPTTPASTPTPSNSSTPTSAPTIPKTTPVTPTPAPTPTKPLSSCPAGTPLRGLNYFKNKPTPVALADHEYPAWLWDVLGETSGSGKGAKKKGAGEAAEATDPALEAMLYAKSKRTRRVASKRLRQQAALHPESREPRVPLYEQSVDLPVAVDGSLQSALEAAGKRDELTRAMRAKRRRDIKEANFLKGMR